MNDDAPLELSRLARFGVALVIAGFFIFVIGVFPDLIRLDLTPGLGVAQILTFLFGIGLMALGGYVYTYAARQRARQRRLRHEVGMRLIATGYVLCIVSAIADTIGIGSHNIPETAPFFGWWQSSGVLLGVLVIILGLFLYAMVVEE
ncbi:MAG TPA: hypothetical protein VI547_01945 [Anaerolineales bacterium]|nr:hypothetical protein [Anaerolineales bacterium]